MSGRNQDRYASLWNKKEQNLEALLYLTNYRLDRIVCFLPYRVRREAVLIATMSRLLALFPFSFPSNEANALFKSLAHSMFLAMQPCFGGVCTSIRC